MNKLTKISIKGYRTFRDVELELGNINVLIGANGCGKSNFISFFRMLNHMTTGRLQYFIQSTGGANVLLYYRSKVTKQIEAALTLETEAGENDYHFRLSEAAPDTLIFVEEGIEFLRQGRDQPKVVPFDIGSKESQLLNDSYRGEPSVKVMRTLLYNCQAYQFHDTSAEARIRKTGDVDKNTFLYRDAGNLAAFLLMLKTNTPYYYDKIVTAIKRTASYFEDFDLEPSKANPRYIMLNWWEAGRTCNFGPHELPDGLLRFMALATLLLQPPKMLPSVIIIDEPELGLHPAAINLLGGLIRSVSRYCQVIIATQSPLLVDQFRPENVIVMERKKVEGKDEFYSDINQGYTYEQLKDWLEDYSLGDIWLKNLIGGRP